MRLKPEKWSEFVPAGEPIGPIQMAVHLSGGIFKCKL